MTKYGYVRISASDPEGFLRVQLDGLLAAGCVKDNLLIDQRTGVAGHRPAYNRLLDRLSLGDEVYVWTLDRIGRSVENLSVVVGEITQRGASLISVGEPDVNIDTRPESNTGHRSLFKTFSKFKDTINSERRDYNKGRKKIPGQGKWRLALSREQVLHAQDVIKNRLYPVLQLTRELNVSSPTLYSYVGPDGELRDRGVRAVNFVEDPPPSNHQSQ